MDSISASRGILPAFDHWYGICPGICGAFRVPVSFPDELAMQRVHRRPRATVLVIEPDPLLRWSLVNYLGRFFHVLAVDSPRRGSQLVQKTRIDALIASDDWESETESLCRLARACNRSLLAIRMIANVPEDPLPHETLRIEKPFQLPELAELLWNNLPPTGSQSTGNGGDPLAGL